MPEFLAEYVTSNPCKRYFKAVGKQTTNLASINKTLLQGLPVPIPSIEEQQEIARHLAAFTASIEVNKEQLQKIHELKKGLLQDLLTGEVRVDIEEAEEAVEKAKESAEAMA